MSLTKTSRLVPARVTFQPLTVGDEDQLAALMEDLRTSLHNGHTLTLTIVSVAVGHRRTTALRCQDCGSLGHASRRYGRCPARQPRQQKTKPPRSDHREQQPNITAALPSTPALPSSRPARKRGVSSTAPLTPPSSQEPSPEGLVVKPAALQATLAALSPLVEALTPTRERQTAEEDRPVLQSTPEPAHATSPAAGGLITPDAGYMAVGTAELGWSPTWELQALSPDSLRRAKEKFPWAWEELAGPPSLTDDPDDGDFNDIPPDDVRLLWCAANTRGGRPTDQNMYEWVLDEVEKLHDMWEKEAASGSEEPWTVVRRKRQRRADESRKKSQEGRQH